MPPVKVFMFVLLVMLSTILCKKRKPKSQGLIAKINQLQSVFQKEVFDLKLELHDLRTELIFEQEKTTHLEDLLNETRSAVPESDNFETKGGTFPSTMHEVSKLQVAVKILQVAFQDGKEQLAKILTDVSAMKSSVRANKDDIEHVDERVQSLSRTIENVSTEIKASVQENTERIRNIDSKLSEKGTNEPATTTSNEPATTTSNEPATTTSSFDDLDGYDYGYFGYDYTDLLNTEEVSSTTTTTVKPTTDNYAKCLAALRAGGPRAAEILYIGVTVRRGKDWDWGTQDGGGQGQIYRLPDDLKTSWLKVEWENNHKNSYRMGMDGKYDLDVVEDKYEFSKCPLM